MRRKRLKVRKPLKLMNDTGYTLGVMENITLEVTGEQKENKKLGKKQDRKSTRLNSSH